MTIFPSAVTAFVCVFGLSNPVYVFTAGVTLLPICAFFVSVSASS